MKAKRFLSIFVAILMMISCFAISASAEDTYTLIINLYETNTNSDIANTDYDTTNPVAPGSSYNAIQDDAVVKFNVYKVSDDATSTTPPTGVAPVEVTSVDGIATFTTTTAGRYLVVVADDPAYADENNSIVPFLVDLPRTNTAGTAKENTVTVYPKMLVTGALELTKTFNGAAPSNGMEATFTVTGPNNYSDTVTTNENGKIQIDGLTFGTYTLTETAVTAPFVVNSTPITFNVTKGGCFDANGNKVGTVETATFDNTSKTTPTITKTVKASDETTYSTSANIHSIDNQTADWKITATLPSDIKSYTKYVITDKIDERLVFDGSTPITVSNLNPSDYENTYDPATRTLTIKLKNFENLTPSTNVEITFSTKIDTTKENSVANNIPNHVELDYKNAQGTEGNVDNNTPLNPDDPDSPTRPDPYVWTGKIEATKIGSDTNAGLAGAQFTLNTLSNSTYTVVVPSTETGTDGKFSFVGVEDGTYYLIETKAPQSYELNTTPIEVTVTNGVATVNAGSTTINIVNIPKTDLPLTGGMGTGLFSMLGLAFVTVGGVFLFKSKKAKASV